MASGVESPTAASQSPQVTGAAFQPKPTPGLESGMQTLQGLCLQAASEVTTREQFLGRLATVLSQVVRPDTVVHCRLNDDGSVALDGLLHPVTGLSEEFRKALSIQGANAIHKRTAYLGRLGRPPAVLLVAVPVHSSDVVKESIAVLFTSPPTTADVLIAVVELVVAQVSLWDARHAARSQDDAAETAAAILDLIARLESAPHLRAAAQQLVGELSQYLDGPEVHLLQYDHERFSLVASHGESIPLEKRRDLLVSAAEEALIRGEAGVWPTAVATQRHALLTHRQLATEAKQEAVVSIPLLDETSRPQGVLVLLGDSTLVDPGDGVAFLRGAAPPLAGCLKTIARAERPAWLQTLDRWGHKLRSRTSMVIASLAIVLLGVMFVPWPYRIACDCEVQPVTRRYIAAPFEGRLESALVEPGDAVTENQVLARLDGREIHWELEGVLADLHRSLKEVDGYQSAGEYGDAEVARLEAERLRLKSELLQHRSERLEITSPISGVIVAGDLRKTEGAPVTVGQTMFEIAPLDEMLVEIQIPESEVRYVTPGMSVRVALDAFPDRVWEGTVQRVYPRAEIRQDQQVFLAELQLSNEYELLRPGMQGRVKITSASHPIGWNLFHHAWEQAGMWAGF
ncbi:MAG: efflux RND transporter periplasmic adaptor subunit [Planctomycetaceae bacterium]|nr:efflux RND transporter periplasmic adaptor subunit [Planctomycetaceae bacterium]